MSVVFHAPPGWPPPPVGWLPPPGWNPPRSWPSAPSGWTFYLELVPTYRSRLMVRTAWASADPGYVGRRLPVSRVRAFARDHAMVLVPLGLVLGVVVVIVLMAGLALSANSLESTAIQACSRILDDEAPRATSSAPARSPGRSVVIDEVRTASPTLIVVTGIYRGAQQNWSFTCPVSTAAGTPLVGEIEWQSTGP